MKSKLEDDIDALFKLPLAEFTSERNALAARLKKEGRRDDADRVKLLAKPSVSAWTVNQLYWDHRAAFNQLMASGKRLRPTGKAQGMRDSLDARREALVNLSELATELLREAGSNPSPDTLRRVTTTLEALGASALLSNGPTPGRLTQDLDPPSFDSLASLMSGAATTEEIDEPPARKSNANVRRLEEARRAKIADAKVTLQDAKKSLSEARARVQSLESASRKANAEVREAEKILEKATAAANEANRRAKSVATEVVEATKTVEVAKRAIEQATKELESLLRSV